MTTQQTGDDAREAAQLRARAETRLAKGPSSPAEAAPAANETLQLVHELRVHLHELERQNQELRENRNRLEESLQDCTDLFDFAPIGYCVLDAAGVILRANLAGAALLGTPRAELAGRPLTPFLEPQARPDFIDFLERTLIGDARQTCRVTLQPAGAPADAPLRQLLLEGRAADADRGGRSLVALVDITEQVRLEAERTAVLSEYADLYRAIVDSRVIVKLLIDPGSGRILEANCAAADYYGRSQEELRRLFLYDLRADSSHEETLAMLATDASGLSGHPDRDARHRLASGEIRDVSIYPEVLRHAGRVLVLATVIDVTERRQLDERLRASEQQFRALVETTSDCIWEMDAAQRFTYLSPQFEQITGYTPAEALGRGSLDLFGALPLQGSREAVLARFLDKGRMSPLQLTLRHRDGRAVTVEASAVPVLGPGGELLGIRGITRDVTERVRQTEALAEARAAAARHASDQRLGALVEQGLVGVSETDQAGRLTRVNDRYCELHGAPREALLGRRLSDLVVPEDRQRIRACEERLLGGGLPEVYDKRYRRPGGRLVYAQTAAVAVRDNAGLVTGLLGLSTDITAQREAEERLREGDRRLIRALEGAGHGVWDWTIATDTLVFSAASQAMYGYAAEPLPTAVSEWVKLIHPEDFARAREAVQAHLAGATPSYECVIRVRCKDRRWMWVLDRGAVLERDATGRPLRMLGTHTDITAQKEAEEELRKTRNSLAEAQRISHLGSFEHDVVAGRLVWSDEVHRIYGLEPTDPSPSYEELLARCIHPEDAERVNESYTAAVRQCAVYELEHRIVRPDGSVRWVYALAHPYYDASGQLARYVGTVLDITERKRTEAELHRIHAILEAALSAMSDAVFVSDAEGQIVYFNDAFVAFHRFDRDEQWLKPLAEYADVFDLRLADGTPARMEQWPMSRALGGETGIGVEYGLLRKDTGETWLASYNFAPIRGPDGTIIGSVGTGRDITEDKALRRALEHERATLEAQVRARTADLRILAERMELAAEAGGIGVWEWDMDSGDILWDGRMRGIYGLPKESPDPSYETWSSWVAPEDIAVAETAVQAVLEGELTVFKATFLIHCPDGRDRHIASRGRLRQEDTGPSRVMIGVNWDVTEERRAAAALVASEARARAVIESSPVPLAIAQQTGPVRYLNAAFVRTFGYTLEDLPTWDDFRRLALPDPAERERLRRLGLGRLAQTEQDGGSCAPLEIEVHCKDGSPRTVIARVTILGGEERLNTLYDITELKEARDAAEQASRTKSEFLAHMSHEIRTPMNSVLGLAQLLERTTLDPNQRAMVRQLRSAGRALLEIINDILDLSKIEAKRLELEARPFALPLLLASVGELLDPAAREKGLTLRIARAPELEGALLGDPLRLEQILVNLIGNGIKFTDSGEVRLRVETLEITAESVRLRFEVLDTGIGIGQETLAKLFAPFVQGDSSIVRRFGGTGLGLAICKRLTEAMGGQIGAESLVGQGSLFWLELPFARTAETPALPPWIASESVPTGPRLTGFRVLVADDSAMNREVVQRMLVFEGASVATATNGQEVLDRLRADSDRFDAVLMDLQMPTLDGLRASRLIRSELGLSKLPIVALTAAVLPEQEAAAREAGMNDVLTKPLDMEKMVAVLSRWTAPKADPARTALPPAAETVCDETEGIPEIRGIDPVRATRALGGNLALFRELLDRFAEECGGVVADMRRALTTGERQRASRLMHTLRGNAGIVGALEIVESATNLELAINGGESNLDTYLDTLDNRVADLIAAIAPWRRSPFATVPTPGSPHSAPDPERLQALREALRTRDRDALSHFNVLRPALVEILGQERMAALDTAVRSLQFAEALALLVPASDRDP